MFITKNHMDKVLLALLAFFSCNAISSLQGLGKVGIIGAINSTPCTIIVGSKDQTIDMGALSLGQIIRDGRGVVKKFSIELANCVVERSEKKYLGNLFQVTFEGRYENSMFGIQGDLGGISLKIQDISGFSAIPGIPLPLKKSIQNDNVLNYSMFLIPNQLPLKEGVYFATVRFKLDYF